MKNLFLLIQFISFFNICASQEIETFTLNDFNLKGKVKEIFTDEDDQRQKFDSTGKLIELSYGKSYAYDIQTFKFDSLARLVFYEYLNDRTNFVVYFSYIGTNQYHYKSYMHDEIQEKFICTIDEYSNLTEVKDTSYNLLLSYVNTYDSLGNLIKIEIYSPENKNSPARTFDYVYAANSLIKYTINGRSIHNEKFKFEKVYNNFGELTDDIKIIKAQKRTEKTLNTYNDLGLLIKTEKFEDPEFDNPYKTLQYTDYVIDSYGNWISRKLQTNDSTITHTRTIVYY